MASILCRHGGVEHRHDSVQAVKECVGLVAAVIDQQESKNCPVCHVYKWKCRHAHEGVELTDRQAQSDYNAPYDPIPPTAEQMERAANRQKPPDQLEVGIYKVDGDLYRVKLNNERTRVYALRLVTETTPVYSGSAGDVDTIKHRWEYDRGAIYGIKASHKATADEVAQFGHEYNTCVNCFQELRRGESRRRGYGPDCANNNGWEYDHSSKD